MFEQFTEKACVDYEFAMHHTLACGSSKFSDMGGYCSSDIVTKTSAMTCPALF